MICRLKTFLNGIQKFKLPDVRRGGNRLRGCLKILELEETSILDDFLLLPPA